MLDRLERKFGRYALANLPIFLVAGQVAVFGLSVFKPQFAAKLLLIPAEVLNGEVWRLFTFVFIPPVGFDPMSPALSTWNLIWLFFGMMLLYTFGRGIEAHWGAFRFNVFVLVAWLATVVGACVYPYTVAGNVYMMGSIMLAFAFLVPDYEIRLFFILPVKVKWFAFAFGALCVWRIVMGSMPERVLILAGVCNFFVFCGNDIRLRLRGAGRRTAKRQQAKLQALQPTHKCEVCGITDLDDKDMQFRYCSKCEGQRGYCSAHLKEHEHIRG